MIPAAVHGARIRSGDICAGETAAHPGVGASEGRAAVEPATVEAASHSTAMEATHSTAVEAAESTAMAAAAMPAAAMPAAAMSAAERGRRRGHQGRCEGQHRDRAGNFPHRVFLVAIAHLHVSSGIWKPRRLVISPAGNARSSWRVRQVNIGRCALFRSGN
jgi:hypothetical protein